MLRKSVVSLTLAAAVGLVPGTARAASTANVVIIGGSTLDTPCIGYGDAANEMGWTWGGCLELTSGSSGVTFGAVTFTPMLPAAVSAASLAPFDTAVLNMAATALRCSTGALSAQAKIDLVAWVETGKKLVIFDSECAPGPDYSWLPFAFSTNNPGAMGAAGTLNVLENSTLGSALAGASFVDRVYLGASIDAVGDMNVVTSSDSHWCVALSGTNVNGVTGAVHTYATYPSGTDRGLIIYNGLDQDYQPYEHDYGYGGSAGLMKLWSLELAQPFNPSNLPCVVVVTGIKLAPDGVTRNVGNTHTVTATLADLTGAPRPGIEVTFSKVGPNAGAAGTCVPADCKSDASGTVTYSYVGSAVGADTITGTITGATASVTVTWQSPVERTPPACAVTGTGRDAAGQAYVQVTLRDTGSGLASAVATVASNATVTIPAFAPGTTQPVVVTATKLNQTQMAQFALKVTDVAGNSTACDPVVAGESEAAPQTGCSGGPAGLAALLGAALAALLRRRR